MPASSPSSNRGRAPLVAAAASALVALAAAAADPSAEASDRPAAANNDAIRPFRIQVPESDLQDLRRRILATRWPEKETVGDESQGVQLATSQAVARYWASEYDWRRCEAKLNSYPQFITEIDGLDIHFIHVRSKHRNALPVIVSHGWPGSMVEQLKIIEPLTDPTAHGGSADDAFDVVIPNMPGYGFSGKPAATGWGPDRIARAWITLMKRLGYARFVAQGGDWGAIVVDLMAKEGAPELLAIHTNMPGAVPADVAKSLRVGGPPPSGLSAEERRAYEQLDYVFKHVGYAIQMGTRPQSLTGLADSPVGLAAFMLDHDKRSQEQIADLFVKGRAYGAMTRDDVLDNVTLFWLSNTALSAARLYWENKFDYFEAKNVSIPVAVSVFPDELYEAPRNWAERAYPKLLHYNRLPTGGHFAAWEQPKLFTTELRMAFKSLR